MPARMRFALQPRRFAGLRSIFTQILPKTPRVMRFCNFYPPKPPVWKVFSNFLPRKFGVYSFSPYFCTRNRDAGLAC